MSEMSVEQMKERLRAAADVFAPELELDYRPMFGGACAYVEGRVFASLSNVGLALKLPPAAQERRLAEPDAKRLQYAPDDPPSKQYVVAPAAVVADDEALAGWLRDSVEYVRTLPAPKPRRK